MKMDLQLTSNACHGYRTQWLPMVCNFHALTELITTAMATTHHEGRPVEPIVWETGNRETGMASKRWLIIVDSGSGYCKQL